jgi:hypothetical protein
VPSPFFLILSEDCASRAKGEGQPQSKDPFLSRSHGLPGVSLVLRGTSFYEHNH